MLFPAESHDVDTRTERPDVTNGPCGDVYTSGDLAVRPGEKELDRDGFAVGPDLFGIRNQPKESILLHVLVPDHEITPGFGAYTVATKDGRVLTGLVASETPTSITLRQPLGKEDTILRGEIDELAASKQSLMPQGLEKNISRQEFADLLGYLKGEAGRD